MSTSPHVERWCSSSTCFHFRTIYDGMNSSQLMVWLLFCSSLQVQEISGGFCQVLNFSIYIVCSPCFLVCFAILWYCMMIYRYIEGHDPLLKMMMMMMMMMKTKAMTTMNNFVHCSIKLTLELNVSERLPKAGTKLRRLDMMLGICKILSVKRWMLSDCVIFSYCPWRLSIKWNVDQYRNTWHQGILLG